MAVPEAIFSKDPSRKLPDVPHAVEYRVYCASALIFLEKIIVSVGVGFTRLSTRQLICTQDRMGVKKATSEPAEGFLPIKGSSWTIFERTVTFALAPTKT